MSKPLTAERLRKTNIYAGVLHLAQMAAVLALSSDFSLPINATYMSAHQEAHMLPQSHYLKHQLD